MNHNSKPLSESEKEFRAQQNSTDDYRGGDPVAVAHDCWKVAADELQAWLRETDKVLARYEKDRKYLRPQMLRQELLGTTRTEGESSE